MSASGYGDRESTTDAISSEDVEVMLCQEQGKGSLGKGSGFFTSTRRVIDAVERYSI